jgi:23S rRNA pseudouridine1911/1915/1917 synthase
MAEATDAIDVPPEANGVRLDAFLAQRGLATRSQVERLAREGKLRVGGKPAKAGRKLETGERVEVQGGPPAEAGAAELVPEAQPLAVLYEDEAVIVLNMPPGLVVHPGAGRTHGTLANALLAHLPTIAGGESHRPGLVHRLDRDTSGVMVVAKTQAAYESLSQQVREHEMDRRYLVLAWGRIAEDRLLIEVPIGRHTSDRKRMQAVPAPAPGRKVRAASTDFRVQVRSAAMTLVEAKLGTGRTHQIRVHLAHVGHPVVGDPVYGLRAARQAEAELDTKTLELVQALPGQALHAQTLRFRHPVTGQEVSFSASPPPELARLLVHLQASVL